MWLMNPKISRPAQVSPGLRTQKLDQKPVFRIRIQMVGFQIWQKLTTRKRNKMKIFPVLNSWMFFLGGWWGGASPRAWKFFMET
jgi:hypothetical protein